MITLSFQVPLNEDGLRTMAIKAKQVRDEYDAKRNPDEHTAWHMLYSACLDARHKVKRK